jgi:hypothetical protein
MGFFERLFKGGPKAVFSHTDPTRSWPVATGPAPQISLERQALESFGGRLPFGGSVSAAHFLGRADACDGTAANFTAHYARWGLDVIFEGGALAEVQFTIGATFRREPAGVVRATPRGPDGRELSAETTEADLFARFGEPESRQDFEDETILYYAVGPLVSEFQLDAEHRLTGWHVYLD